MRVLNNLDRFHLTMDVIHLLPEKLGTGGPSWSSSSRTSWWSTSSISPSTARICRKSATGSGTTARATSPDPITPHGGPIGSPSALPCPAFQWGGGGLSTSSTLQSGTFPFPPKCAMISGRPALPGRFICQRKEVLRLVTRPYPQRGRSGKGSRPPAAVPAGPALHPGPADQPTVQLGGPDVHRPHPRRGRTALTGVGVTMPLILCISAFAALVSMGGAPPGFHPPGERGKGPGRAGPGQLHHHAGDHCPGSHGGGPGLWAGSPFVLWGQPGHPSLCLGLH